MNNIGTCHWCGEPLTQRHDVTKDYLDGSGLSEMSCPEHGEQLVAADGSLAPIKIVGGPHDGEATYHSHHAMWLGIGKNTVRYQRINALEYHVESGAAFPQPRRQ